MMADYLFNLASVLPPYTDSARARSDLVSLLTGLAALDGGREVLPRFRISRDPWVVTLVTLPDGRDLSLGEMAMLLYDEGHRDVAAFFDSLIRLMPADANLTEQEIEAVLGLEPMVAAVGYEEQLPSVTAASIDSAICAIVGALMASFPSSDLWRFDELNFVSSCHHYSFDHLATGNHAQAIHARRVNGLRDALTRRNFWESRAQAFPHLQFAPRIQGDIERFSASLLPLLFRRLATLDRMASEWARTSIFPTQPLKVSSETPATMARYGGQRSFEGYDGVRRIFELHIWVDGLHRIHIFRHQQTRLVEVGYVGTHLSTMTFPT